MGVGQNGWRVGYRKMNVVHKVTSFVSRGVSGSRVSPDKNEGTRSPFYNAHVSCFQHSNFHSQPCLFHLPVGTDCKYEDAFVHFSSIA